MELLKDIGAIVSGIMISIGAASGIIYAILKWCSDAMADKFSQKYAKQLSEELEKYKAELGKKVYIGNQRFDLAFSIYSELASALVDMTETSYFLRWTISQRIRKICEK